MYFASRLCKIDFSLAHSAASSSFVVYSTNSMVYGAWSSYTCSTLQFSQGTVPYPPSSQSTQPIDPLCNLTALTSATWLCPGYHYGFGNVTAIATVASAVSGLGSEGTIYMRSGSSAFLYDADYIFYEAAASYQFDYYYGITHQCELFDSVPPHNCANLAPAPCDFIGRKFRR